MICECDMCKRRRRTAYCPMLEEEIENEKER